MFTGLRSISRRGSRGHRVGRRIRGGRGAWVGGGDEGEEGRGGSWGGRRREGESKGGTGRKMRRGRRKRKMMMERKNSPRSSELGPSGGGSRRGRGGGRRGAPRGGGKRMGEEEGELLRRGLGATLSSPESTRANPETARHSEMPLQILRKRAGKEGRVRRECGRRGPSTYVDREGQAEVRSPAAAL